MAYSEENLNALLNSKAQIQAQLDSLMQKIRAARMAGASPEQMQALRQEGIDIDQKLSDVSDEISKIEKEKQLHEEQLLEQQRKAKMLAAEAARLAAEREKLEKERLELEALKAQWKEKEAKLNSVQHDLDSVAQNILDILKVQLTPATQCVEVNDVFIKHLFKINATNFQQALQGKTFHIQEKKKTKKRDAVLSKVNIQNAKGFDNTDPLNEFDRAVLGAIISEIAAGNLYTTVNIIFRSLIGKVGQAYNGITPYKNQRTAIIQSILKCMGTIVNFSGAVESLKTMKYISQNGDELSFGFEPLLSVGIVSAKVNGQALDSVIYFKDNSPLFHIANKKDQIVRYPSTLLNVPHQNNTPLIISLKKYVMRRICEIKLHKQLTPTITFDDVFQKCSLENADRHKQFDARNAIIKLMAQLQEQGFISFFKIVKRGNVIHGITFKL